VSYSITAKLYKGLHDLIAAIEERAGCRSVLDRGGSRCRPGQIPAFSKQHPRPASSSGGEATPAASWRSFHYDYHAFITNRRRTMIELGGRPPPARRRREVITRLKYGVGLPLPSGRFSANAAWLLLNVLAHNLARWVPRIGSLRGATDDHEDRSHPY